VDTTELQDGVILFNELDEGNTYIVYENNNPIFRFVVKWNENGEWNLGEQK